MFWQKVCTEIQTSLGLTVPFKSRIFLSHDYKKWKKIKLYKYLVLGMLMAASILIARYWKLPNSPSIWEWRQNNVFFLLLMVSLSALNKARLGSTRALLIFWEQWTMVLLYCSGHRLNPDGISYSGHYLIRNWETR